MVNLINELDGAYLVRTFGSKVWAWFGGAEITCYDMQGNIVEKLELPNGVDDAFSVEDFLVNNRQATNNQPREEDLEEDQKKKPKGLWHNIRARRAAGKPRLKPGQKGYPKTLNIESKEFRELIKDLLQQQLKE